MDIAHHMKGNQGNPHRMVSHKGNRKVLMEMGMDNMEIDREKDNK